MGFVLHNAVDFRINRIIAPEAYVAAWMNPRTELADQDVAGFHCLAGVDLDAAMLPRTVASVAGRALSLFVCHGRYTSESVGVAGGSCPVAPSPIS
jgi:hypothetical protein